MIDRVEKRAEARRTWAWIAIVAIACACASERNSSVATTPAKAADAERRASEPTPAPRAIADAKSSSQPLSAPAPLPWEGFESVVSNGGTYRIRYRIDPAPLPRGQLFALDAWVVANDALERALTDVTLSVDAAMPEHEHGMNRIPVIKALESGHFRVEGLLFHMAGRWEMYFDVTRGDVTERAQIEVRLE